jgi:hypothetical protein
MRRKTPPSAKDMQALAALAGSFDWIDVVEWQEEVGLQRGVVFDTDTGQVTFEEYPLEPHEGIIWEFSNSFSQQFINPWRQPGAVPNFQCVGSACKPSKYYLVSEANAADFQYPGNIKKSADCAFRPLPRPNPNNLPTAALVQLQPVFGLAWPTIVLEASQSQPATRLVVIRDFVLGWRTQVNIYFTVSFNRNTTPATESWWAQLAIRDVHAPAPPPNADDKYPGCVVLHELPVVNGRYPRLENPLPPNTIWSVPTTLLYHPEPVPQLVPPLPPSYDINLEEYRLLILRSR